MSATEQPSLFQANRVDPITPNGIVRGDVFAGAEFSPDGLYRYRLWRRPNPMSTRVCIIMCNPSDADHADLDPTTRRVDAFVAGWGYRGGWVGVNAIPYISTDPKRLRNEYPIQGPANDLAILLEARQAGLVVVAWGAHPALRTRGPAVARMLIQDGIELRCIRKTKLGHPEHPLYLPASLLPVPWSPTDVIGHGVAPRRARKERR